LLCESPGRANARPMANSAKQSYREYEIVDCFIASLLRAMTVVCRVRETALLTLATFRWDALADNFPSDPITLVVPFSAGGPTDAMARILGDRIAIDGSANEAGASGSGRAARRNGR